MRCLIFMLAALFALAGCGGGSGGTDVFDDHLWAGCNSAEGGDWHLDDGAVMHSVPTPIQRLNALVLTHNIDRCRNGLQLRELIDGLPVAKDAPPGAPVEALASVLAHDPSPYVVIAMGEVEALFTDQTPAEHLEQLVEADRIIRAAGKTSRIGGLIRFAPSDVITPARIARRDAFDDLYRSFAADRGLVFFDRGAAEFRGAVDERPDQLHPGPDYQQRIAEVIAAAQRAARVPAH